MIDKTACIAEISAVLRRHNRRGSDAQDRAYVEEVSGYLTEMAAAADRLRGLANGTIPLDTPPDTPPPETRDQDSPSRGPIRPIPPSYQTILQAGIDVKDQARIARTTASDSCQLQTGRPTNCRPNDSWGQTHTQGTEDSTQTAATATMSIDTD